VQGKKKSTFLRKTIDADLIRKSGLTVFGDDQVVKKTANA
jgi:hypothetical protein